MSFDFDSIDEASWGCYDQNDFRFSDLNKDSNDHLYDEYIKNCSIEEYLDITIDKSFNNYDRNYNKMIKKKNILLNKVLNLDNNYKVLRVTLDIFFNEYLKEIIDSYSKEEKLPKEYLAIVNKENCLSILIKGFLKKQCYFKLEDSIIIEIDNLINEIYRNSDNLIVYDRVNKIQKYIHFKVQNKFGVNEHLKLNKHIMKNLLSTSRLHLNIYDFQKINLNNLSDIIDKTRESVNNEYKKPSKLMLFPNKKFIPIWKAHKSKSVIEFLDPYNLDKLYRILDVDVDLNSNEYKKQIIEANLDWTDLRALSYRNYINVNI